MSRGLLAGTASVTVDGTTYMVEGAFKYRPSTVKRETLTGMDGVHGYKETPVAGAISMSLRDAGDFLVATVNGMRNVTVVAQLANGADNRQRHGLSTTRRLTRLMRSSMCGSKARP